MNQAAEIERDASGSQGNASPLQLRGKPSEETPSDTQ